MISWRRSGRTATTTLFVAAAVLPVCMALAASFTPESRIFGAPSLDVRALTLDHYRTLFKTRDFWLPIRNSLVVGASTTVVAVTIGGLCAYSIERLMFRGKNLILAAVLAVSVFPQIAIVSPLYLVLRDAHLIDTYPGVVLPYLTFATPLSVWLLAGFLRQVPIELEEAALVDGATRLQVLCRIVFPVALPGVAATAILTFLYCWNEFLFALSFTLGPDRQTVPVAIALFRGQYQVPWGQVLAAAIVATIPVAVVVMIVQRRIVQGLTAGSIKR
jgi:ABC-type glycerol-3-phosphate transport system permease component